MEVDNRQDVGVSVGIKQIHDQNQRCPTLSYADHFIFKNLSNPGAGETFHGYRARRGLRTYRSFTRFNPTVRPPRGFFAERFIGAGKWPANQ